ncbi:MAG: pyruvate ferredoxin oxidoreductase, partial [Candidatus Limnocylindrales bacterium]
GVIDRDFAHGAPDGGGILFHDVRSCLYPVRDGPLAVNFIAGLGGRDISIAETSAMFEHTLAVGAGAPTREPVTWVGVRESEKE